MAGKSNGPLSNDTFLTILGVIAGICAALFDQWAARTIFVFLGMALIVYAGRRHDSHPSLRYPITIVALIAFSFFPWASIWNDFHKNFPTTEWPQFVTLSSFHWALAILSSVVLLWQSRPVWRIRRRVVFQWRRTVESEVWTDRDTALEIIKKSKWGTSRKPGGGFFDSMMFVQKPQFLAQYERFCEMTLESFAAANKPYIRNVDDRMEFREDKLREFLRVAYDDDVRQQFGKIPNTSV